MHKKIFIIIFSLVCTAQVWAQQDNGYTYIDTAIVEAPYVEDETYDETITEVTTTQQQSIDELPKNSNQLSEEDLKKWKAKKEFSYMKNLDSMLKAMQEEKPPPPPKKTQKIGWFAKLIGSGLLQTILWVIAGLAIAYVLYKILAVGGLLARKPKQRKLEETYSEDEQFLKNDFESLIRKAEQDGDFRLATRYRFIKMLKRMDERSHIAFAIDKTNSVYKKELPPQYRADFSKAAFYYEHVWYGEVSLDQDNYHNIASTITQLEQRL